ncbi:MAG: hypothetical protein ACK53K_07925 [Burkholderiales bacterium]
MNIVNVLLAAPVDHNLEVIGEYLCLFDSAARNRIKFLKLDDRHIDEMLAARFHASDGSREQMGAFRRIVHSRVMKWVDVHYPDHFLGMFEDFALSDPEYFGPPICDSFEFFVAEYFRYWDSVSELMVRTPFDQHPSEEQLRELHASLVEKLSPYAEADAEAEIQ